MHVLTCGACIRTTATVEAFVKLHVSNEIRRKLCALGRRFVSLSREPNSVLYLISFGR